MAKIEKHIPILTRSEVLWGWVYLIFEMLFLPTVLAMGNQLLPTPLSSGWLNFVYFCVNFAIVCLIFRRFLGHALSGLGSNLFRVLKAAFMGFCVLYVTNQGMAHLTQRFFPWFSNVNDNAIASMLEADFYPMFIGTVFLVPFTEEILFRGLVFRSLHSVNRPLGWILSAALFCSIHVMGYVGSVDTMTILVAFVQYIPAALCLTWSYTESDNIFAPILIHALVNTMGIYAVR